MKAVGYLRVSTEEQALEGYSISSQKNQIIECCKANQYELIDFYADEGVSGKSLKRPKVMELIADVKAHKFDIIVIYRLDRLSRSLKDLADLIELFDKFNVLIKSTSEELDISSLSGRAMIQMLGVFAEFERGSISERIIVNLEQRVRDGYFHSPGGMFGYTYDKENKIYNINPEEAAIIQEIFAMHQSGLGVNAICRSLNSRGIKTARGRTFYRSFIARMLRDGWHLCGKLHRKTRSGEIIHKDAINILEAILTEEVFLRSNKIYAATFTKQRKKHGDDRYIFKGKLRCAYCGRVMLTSSCRKKKKQIQTKQTLYLL